LPREPESKVKFMYSPSLMKMAM